MSGMGSGGPDDNDAQAGRLVAHSLRAEGFDASEDGTGRWTPLVATPLTSGGHPTSNTPGRRKEDDTNIVAFNASGGGEKDISARDNLANPVTGSNGDPGAIASLLGVRRLTPVECERLQGFPDGWTDIGDTADSPRYSALGDAVTVNVAEWIGSQMMRFSLEEDA